MDDARKLLPCPLCGGEVRFCGGDKQEDCCGCHRIICDACGDFDLSRASDPDNTSETLDVLRERIAPRWNRRPSSMHQNEFKEPAEIRDGCAVWWKR